jgi:aminoglycoside phosphotransferase (APT) family kinase protein
VIEAAARLREDLQRHLGEPVHSVEPIPEGHSGFTYWVRLDAGRAVLRVPPPGARIAGPADIPRQGRLMAALHGAGLPVPAVLSMSERPVIDGRPFYLVEAVDGDRVETVSGVADAEIARAAVAVLRRLQALPPARTGIGDEPATPLTKELARWSWLMERAPAELTGGATALNRRLAATAPAERPPVLVHGDYHYGNMLFRGAAVVALLDWEIAQIGQPLLDLACLAVVARAGQAGATGIPGGGSVVVDDRELLAAYGADPEEFRWYLALTYYKYAAIFGYNLMLHRRGKRPDPIYETRTRTISEFIDRGHDLLGA